MSSMIITRRQIRPALCLNVMAVDSSLFSANISRICQSYAGVLTNMGTKSTVPCHQRNKTVQVSQKLETRDF